MRRKEIWPGGSLATGCGKPLIPNFRRDDLIHPKGQVGDNSHAVSDEVLSVSDAHFRVWLLLNFLDGGRQRVHASHNVLRIQNPSSEIK
jgi:hypothetical protein